MKLEHGIYVAMSVKCIGKLCQNCPNLEVDTSIFETYVDGVPVYETDLQCKNLHRCLQLYNMMEDDYKKYGGAERWIKK